MLRTLAILLLSVSVTGAEPVPAPTGPQTADSARQFKQFIYQRLDKSDDNRSQAFLKQIVQRDFGLEPYETNYLLPFAYGSRSYADNYQHTEAELQVSLLKLFTFNLLGLDEAFGFAYTLESWWQLYAESAPFRETDHRPELFFLFPVTHLKEHGSGLRFIKIGYLHESNGQGGDLSRAWDRFYLEGTWQFGTLFAELQVWHAANFDKMNRDIGDYMGYGQLKFSYIFKKHYLEATLRDNLWLNRGNKGAVEIDWPYPLLDAYSTYWYVKYFNGYGESLMDYDRFQQKFAVGISLSR